MNHQRRMFKKLMAMVLLLVITPFWSGCQENSDVLNGSTDNLPDITGYPVVGTNQITAYNNQTIIATPFADDPFYGQNANYPGNAPRYEDNGDGTITDMLTGLMWQKSFDHNGDGVIDYADKLAYSDVLVAADTTTTGGYDDWRLPTIKEQYSLIDFSGKDVSGYEGTDTEGMSPFIDTKYFDFAYGDTDAGERIIDMQCATTSLYVSNSVEQMVFGVNFADGRIKGYGMKMMGQDKKFNYLLVRGNTTYGKNDFEDNGDGTITDRATGLMWMQVDSDQGMTWSEALTYAEDKEFAGYSDWRLPDAKELQSLVDYTRSPDTNGTAAIDPLFSCTQITNEAGQTDYPFYWSSTTHANWTTGHEGAWGVYVAFGRALGNMSDVMGAPPMGGGFPVDSGATISGSSANWIDVHGAGAQRSDPKDGDPSVYADGHGPQGDAVRIYNFVRLVRSVE